MRLEKEAVRRWVLIALSAVFAVVTTLTAERARSEDPAVAARPALPYNESADPQQDLIKALSDARKSGKRVLVVFGANWCKDCRVLDRELHGDGKTAELVRSRYEVVKVDVGHFDKHLDFVKLYGEPIKKGIPSVVIVTPTNDVVYQTKAGELADARGMGADGIYGFFKDKAERAVGS